ncbi:hypothetical protein BIW11_02961 [Tropilaelaps mercedesae]|uniref:Uncharacterized protein n=1 Tax=Tropilaelaps mercedesae TaxID=418985 RepID=A0A1V9XUD1_9ACAR|nr:hypothetical protein BIW11_02961 [Tropilaelaps mercedesae]
MCKACSAFLGNCELLLRDLRIFRVQFNEFNGAGQS